MYKHVSNPKEIWFQKSLVCSQVEAGKIPADQLLCCFENTKTCSPYSDDSDCLGYDKQVAKCHSLNNFVACNRAENLTDVDARRVCGWQDALFCVSTKASETPPRNPKLIKWIISRSTVEESLNGVLACYNGQDYYLCDSSNNDYTTSSTCGDLFSPEYKCTDENSTKPYRNPVGQLCGVMPTITETVSVPNPTLVLGLSAGLGVTGFLAIGTFALVLNKHFRGKWFC